MILLNHEWLHLIIQRMLSQEAPHHFLSCQHRICSSSLANAAENSMLKQPRVTLLLVFLGQKMAS